MAAWPLLTDPNILVGKGEQTLHKRLYNNYICDDSCTIFVFLCSTYNSCIK